MLPRRSTEPAYDHWGLERNVANQTNGTLTSLRPHASRVNFLEEWLAVGHDGRWNRFSRIEKIILWVGWFSLRGVGRCGGVV